MKLAALNPFQDKQKIKVFGERNTGTAYLEWLLAENLKVELLDYFTLGWKHRLAPVEAEITPQIAQNTLFVCLFKNPYSWLLSLYRRPLQHEELKKLSFSDFIRFPFGDYQNPVVMWNLKNKSYLHLQKYVRHYIDFRYEKLLIDPAHELDKLCQTFGVYRSFSWFMDNQYYITHHHGISEKRFHKNYYLHKNWLESYSAADLDFVNQFLDREILEKLGYEFERK